jgi:uncharacterized protein YutE (UPF0331/DUF86 family)
VTVVDQATLDHMLSNLRRDVAARDGLAALPQAAFLGNPDRIGKAKDHFVIAIECCIDAANHIIVSENFRLPKDTADSFTVLSEEGILPDALLKTFRNMARFRNRLVHLYWDVDDQRVYGYLRTTLKDFHRCAKAVAEHPRTESTGGH